VKHRKAGLLWHRKRRSTNEYSVENGIVEFATPWAVFQPDTGPANKAKDADHHPFFDSPPCSAGMT
jgi:hypothetical protein